MLSEKLVKAYNEQIKNELNSAYIYYGMAAYFDAKSLPGFANWMRVQAQEELFHASKFNAFVFERDGEVELFALDKPAVVYESPLATFKAAYAHEQFITGTINKLYKLAMEVEDYASKPILHWFIEEQIEEEASAKEIVDQLEMIQESKMGIFMLDKQMAARTFTPPAATEE
ncbi:MAG: ferritin [Anaerolineales bacterium]|nr:ferritin [Anaerolineales bacterium]